MGQIKINRNKAYFIISDPNDMYKLISNLNGLIRIQFDSFKEACCFYHIKKIEPNYTIEKDNSYFSGLIDIKGVIPFNFSSNRIECTLELNYNKFTSKLCLDKVISYYKPSIYYRKQFNKDYIIFKFQNVQGMIHLYNYFMKNRLYSDYKFYRISKIKTFIEIRNLGYSDHDSIEYKLYSKFLLN